MHFYSVFSHRNTEHCEAKVLPAITATLKNLKLEYLDLYLV